MTVSSSIKVGHKQLAYLGDKAKCCHDPVDQLTGEIIAVSTVFMCGWLLAACGPAPTAGPGAPPLQAGSTRADDPPVPTNDIEGERLDPFCPVMGVDSSDRIYAFTDETLQMRPHPAPGPDARVSAFATLLEAGYVRPLAIIETRYWEWMTIASSPSMSGAIIAGQPSGPGPCGVALGGSTDVLARYDHEGRCAFAVALDTRGSQLSIAVLDEAHLYIDGDASTETDQRMFLERYDDRGKRIFRKVYSETPDGLARWGPFWDWGEQRIVATKDGVVRCGEERLEALDANGRRRWSLALAEDATWLTADSAGNVYATGFRYDPAASGSDGSSSAKPLLDIGPGQLILRKVDAKGRAVWEQALRDERHTWVVGLASDASNDVWMAGAFTKELRLSERIFLRSRSDAGYTLFIARFDSDGQAEWASTVGEVSRTVKLPFPGRRWLHAGPTGDVVAKLDHLGPLWDVPERPTQPPPTKLQQECSVLRLRADGDSTQITRVW